MPNTKKHSKTTLDFHAFSMKNKVQSLQKTASQPRVHRSLRNYISSFGRKLKKVFYKNFFWGRGAYYKYSIVIVVIMLLLPFVVFAENMQVSSPSSTNSISAVVDTAFDTGNGKTTIPTTKTIDSVLDYIVQNGDTVSGIATKFGITSDTVLYANNLNSGSFLQVGQKLKILPVSGILYTVKSGDTLQSIAKKYNIAAKGYSDQVLLEVNNLDSVDLAANQILLVPGAEPEISVPVVAARPIVASIPRSVYSPPPGVSFSSPTAEKGHISTCYSALHPAVDIDTFSYIPLYASAAGRVKYAAWGWTPGSGNAVVIDHQNGYQTEYYHMSQIIVNAGDYVSQGQQIGLMGATGRATGIHVHFVVKYNGSSVNPFTVLNLSPSIYPREATATTC